jgi:hypothetical protein
MADSQYREIAPEAFAEERGAAGARRASSRNWRRTLSVAVIAVALVVGVGLRVTKLDRMPPALGQDEACDGYDAYSILKTGRDHHGNFMPIVMQGFNDYRMPLFQYSLVPLVGMFGLKATTVRLGAALWGIADLLAIVTLAGLMFGWECAAAAAVLGALMPWHLELSRYGIEATAASATISIAMASFFMWLRRRQGNWLLLSGLSFGLSLYTYAITKALLPLLLGLIAILYWRELKTARVKALSGLAIVIVLALPQAIMFVGNADLMQVEYQHLSLFSAGSLCTGCDSDKTRQAMRSIPYLLMANFAGNFTPSFLFLNGDRGDHWTMIHPPNFGELLPEQAILVLLALIALVISSRRRIAILILGWLFFAAVPAAMIKPLGVGFIEPGVSMPTPWVLLNDKIPTAPVTASMLLAHADSRHAALAMAPWILLSALGFAVLLDLTARRCTVRGVAIVLLLLGVMFHGARYLRYYFEDFPSVAAPYFQYGIKEVLQAIDQKYSADLPVVISAGINQPYIYVLFFEHYPPALFQSRPVPQQRGIFGQVEGFGRYRFMPQKRIYLELPHGVFVFSSIERAYAPPDVLINYPDGNLAYKIVLK